MPFFDANKMGITIDYDDNMCLVGGSLRGIVNIFVRETVTLCGSSLRYRVVEGCSLASGRSSSDVYNIEYVLFGSRSTKTSPSVRVNPGHYCYPFAIPIPRNVPPTQRFGGSNDGFSSLLPTDVLPTVSPQGPAVRVEHLVDVVVYVAHSWKDKDTSRHAPCVISCTTPSALLSLNNGMEGHVRWGTSFCYPGRSFLSKLFNSGPTLTKEQADCDLFVYNTTISLADCPFLHFAIRGKTNCPYEVQLIRCVTYTSIPANARSPNRNDQTGNGNVMNDETSNSQETSAAQTTSNEIVIASTTMPPLDAPTTGVKGRLLISPFTQEQSVSFKSRSISVSYYVTIALQYLSNKASSMIPPQDRMRIPVTIFHGTFEEAVTGVVEEAEYIYENSGCPVSGAVMGYDAPPQGERSNFRPAAPVTDHGLTATQWSNPNNDPVLRRPTNITSTSASALKSAALSNERNPLSHQQNTTSAAETDAIQPKFNEDGKAPQDSEEDSDPLPMSAIASERRSAHRRLYDDVPPSWVRSDRSQKDDVQNKQQ